MLNLVKRDAAAHGPCYILASMPDTREDQLRAGREALTRHAWKEAFERLRAADAAESLSPQDLELFAEAAQWVGQLDEAIAGYERAFKGYLEQREQRRGGFMAIQIAHGHFAKG